MLKQVHTILIVDDDRNTLRLLEKVLGRKFRIITAASGEEAAEILRRQRVSLLLTDQCMPGMTGTELIRESRSVDPNMVCMLLTGKDDVGVFIDALTKSRAIRVINKPWNPDKILADIQAALEKHEAHLSERQSMNRLKEAKESLKKLAPDRSSN